MKKSRLLGTVCGCLFSFYQITSAHAETTIIDKDAKLLASDGAARDTFGWSIAILDGDTTMIAAPYNRIGSFFLRG